MGVWRGLRVAFVLGSVFMILLIIVYWDDVGGFNLYPLQDHKRCPLQSPSCPRTTTPSPSTAGLQSRSPLPVSTTIFSTKGGGAAVEDRQEQREVKTTGGEGEQKRISSRHLDVEQEERKQRIMDVCSDLDFPGRTRSFEQIPNRELDHLIVDDTNQIIYCYVPKVQSAAVWVVLVHEDERRVKRPLPPPNCPHPPSLLCCVLCSGSMHQLEESDGGLVSGFDFTLLRKTLH